MCFTSARAKSAAKLTGGPPLGGGFVGDAIVSTAETIRERMEASAFMFFFRGVVNANGDPCFFFLVFSAVYTFA